MLKKLEDILETDREQFGSKAFYLGALVRGGFKVPSGFALNSCLDEISVLEGGLWALRSSGHDEDGSDYSRAGQYKSYLRVTDLKQGVSRCFRENQIASVIVQEMIESDCGGVCFSSWNNQDGCIEIELCLGPNEGVTKGVGNIARLKVGTDIEVSHDPHGILTHISTHLLLEVAKQVRAIQNLFGFAVDVEWCARGEDIFILQARPITGDAAEQELEQIKAQTLSRLRGEAFRRGYGFWTDYSIGDMFQNPSPLLVALVNHDAGTSWSVRRVYRDLGLNPSSELKDPIFVSICDRAYIDIGSYFDFLFPKSAFVPTRSGLRSRLGEKSWLATLGHFLRIARLPFRVRKLRRQILAKYTEKELSRIFEEAQALANRDYEQMSLDELQNAFEKVLKQVSGEVIYAHLMSDVLAAASQGLLRVCLKALFGSEAKDWEFKLTTGLPCNFNTETTLALYDLGQGRTTMADFMRGFGHRANPDWEIASVRWRETPKKVMQMAEELRNSGLNPHELFAAQVKIRKEAEEALSRHLGGRFATRIFKGFVTRQLDLFQTYSPLREQTQSIVYVFVEVLRKILLALGKKAGIGEEIFHLGKANVMARRVFLPHIFDASDLNSSLFKAHINRSNEASLEGIRVSAGVVEGTARVIDDLREANNFKSNEIVIARFADPSYASSLLCAGGLVLEQGSVFSHTAIIAREFGLPAIVNVEHATLRIRNGQKVTLDADNGKVWVELPITGYSASLSSPLAPIT